MSLTTHPLHVAHPVHIVILVVLTTAFLRRDLRNNNLWLEIDMGGSLIMPFCVEHYKKNTIKAGGSTARAQNVDWTGWVSGYPLDCYDY